MSYIIPNQADGDNGDPYGDVDYDSINITRANDAVTFTWMGGINIFLYSNSSKCASNYNII